MKYMELKEKLVELKQALSNNSNLMQSDEEKIREVTNECINEMSKVESINENYQRCYKKFEELIIKVNTLKQQEDYIFDSDKMSLKIKINKFAHAVNNTSKRAQELVKVKDEFIKIQEQMADEEVNKKIENLTDIWSEIKKMVNIEDTIEPVEMEVIDCDDTTMEDSKEVGDEYKSMLDMLFSEINEEVDDAKENPKKKNDVEAKTENETDDEASTKSKIGILSFLFNSLG